MREIIKICVPGGRILDPFCGAGKSRSYAIPNALNCGECSMAVCDPKSEILRKTGAALKANGFEVRVFDLLNPDASYCYNPLAYVRDDKDVLRLIETLIPVSYTHLYSRSMKAGRPSGRPTA